MASVRQRAPPTPTVISPSPSASELSGQENYFSPRRRSARIASQQDRDSSNSDGERRARSKSKEDDLRRRNSRISGLTSTTPLVDSKSGHPSAQQQDGSGTAANGLLTPASAAGGAGAYFRSLSRSPSPLGLIPIHKEWRTFIHKHEVPRKVLHVSIGFLTLYLYARGLQPSSIHPVLLGLLIPIATVDVVRHNYQPFNKVYIRVLGPFMRESEAHDRYNGVIWYLLGAWVVLRFCHKDVGVMGVVLLSWCDTAASTIGRLYGKYTPKIRQGKSLAGTAAAFATGVASAALFWGLWAPYFESRGLAVNTGANAFAFQGQLQLPQVLQQSLGSVSQSKPVAGPAALFTMSIVSGFVAAASEAVDIFGADDNVTIPILCGIGLWGFLKVFGSA